MMHRARINHLHRRQGGQVSSHLIQTIPDWNQPRRTGRQGRRSFQTLAVLPEPHQLFSGCRLGPTREPPIRQIIPSPAGRRLTAIIGRHRRTESPIDTFRIEHLQLGESKNEVVHPGREASGSDSDIAPPHACHRHLPRSHPGIGHISTGLVFQSLDAGLEFRIVGQLHPVAERKSKPLADAIVVVVATRIKQPVDLH